MAYETPPQWIHGNIVDATKMQKYSDSIVALNTAFGANSLQNVAGVDVHGTDEFWQDWGRWYFINTHRYLWYKGEGFITDPSDGSRQQALSETATDDTWERFDLSTVDWIYPGFLYEVTQVRGALEMWR